jgi:hypothetical protein
MPMTVAGIEGIIINGCGQFGKAFEQGCSTTI